MKKMYFFLFKSGISRLLAIMLVALLLLEPSVFASETAQTDAKANRSTELVTIVETNINFEDVIVGNPNEWIELFDVDLTSYAFFVPLYNSGYELDGYCVLSDVNGNNRILSTCVGKNAGIYAKYIMDAAGQIIYSFPDAFFSLSNGVFQKINLSGASTTIEGGVIKVFANVNATYFVK